MQPWGKQLLEMGGITNYVTYLLSAIPYSQFKSILDSKLADHNQANQYYSLPKTQYLTIS